MLEFSFEIWREHCVIIKARRHGYLGNQLDGRCLGDILSLEMQSVNYWINHCSNCEYYHIIFMSRGIDALSNAEWWWKKQAEAAAGLWRRTLLRETWQSDIAIIQTMIAPRKWLFVIIFSHHKITVPWQSPLQGAGHSPHIFFALATQGGNDMLSLNPKITHLPTHWPKEPQQNPFWCSFLGSKDLHGWSRWGRGWAVVDQIISYLGSALTNSSKAFQNHIVTEHLNSPLKEILSADIRGGLFNVGGVGKKLELIQEFLTGCERAYLSGRDHYLSDWAWLYHTLSIIIQPPNDIFP